MKVKGKVFGGETERPCVHKAVQLLVRGDIQKTEMGLHLNNLSFADNVVLFSTNEMHERMSGLKPQNLRTTEMEIRKMKARNKNRGEGSGESP